MDAARPSDASRSTGPSTARWARCSNFLLIWSLAEVVSVVVYVFAGRLWGFLVAGVLLTLVVLVFMYYYINTRPGGSGESTSMLPVGQQHGQQVNGAGLSQGDIEAIPAFEYNAEEAAAAADGGSGSSVAEECAVCISLVRDGETVRRLPACGHAFHARCINGWLRGHATCPICRANIKVAGDGEPSPAAAAV